MPGYGQYLDLDEVEKAGLVNPGAIPVSLSGPIPQPLRGWHYSPPIQALQVLHILAGEDILGTGRHRPCSELHHHASDISSHVSGGAWETDAP